MSRTLHHELVSTLEPTDRIHSHRVRVRTGWRRILHTHPFSSGRHDHLWSDEVPTYAAATVLPSTEDDQ